MFVSPILRMLRLGDHDGFCSAFATGAQSQASPETGLEREFGFKEDTNRVTGCGAKGKGTPVIL